MPEPIGGALVLGPVLRRVTGTRATVWVQTARPGTVEVRGGRPSDGPHHAGPHDGKPHRAGLDGAGAGGAARTFTAHGRHFALVVVDGLAPGAATPYRVLLDGEEVWPPPRYPFPPPVIRTRAPGQPVRLVFGSCRQASPRVTDRYPPDALDAYARRLAEAVRTGGADGGWPDSLMLLGDQVYADETSPVIRGWLLRRRHRRRPDAPADQVVGFGEYAALYLESWTDPEARWLLSTVPSLMIFDDHEIIDDWNTSEAWRTDMQARSWWRERIAAGLASYWVFQHMGNLDPDALAGDPVFSAVSSAADATEVLTEFGAGADDERSGYRWSYALDIGDTRIVVLDNRCARQLDPAARRMLPDAEWSWLAERLQGRYRHLVLGCSLPWLMPPAIHDVEAMNERLCASRVRPVAWLAERLRRGWDLEHWAAFGASFEALGVLFDQLGSGPDAPATISVLSGDVHHSYVARAGLGRELVSAVHQLTCSPVHNELPPALKPAVRVGWSRTAARVARAVAGWIGTPAPGVDWGLVAGPFYGNAVGTLVHQERHGYATIEGTDPDGRLRALAELDLTATTPPGAGDGAATPPGAANPPADTPPAAGDEPATRPGAGDRPAAPAAWARRARAAPAPHPPGAADPAPR